MKKQITQSDIAKLANVTRQTVSLVLNNDPRVNSDTRTKILKIMDELGYQPNTMARNLASRSSKTIGFHFFDLEWESFSQPVFSDGLAGIYFRANELGYSIKLYRLETDQDYAAPFRSGDIDGAIFVTYDKKQIEERLIPLLDKGFPIVVIGSHEEFPRVSIDHRTGVRIGTEHLISKRKKRILYLGGDLEYRSNEIKYESFQKTLQTAGSPHNSDLAKHNLYLTPHGYDAVKEALKKEPDFNAVFAAVNDQVALGALGALKEAGIRIPGQIPVIGYDDSKYAHCSIPALSTVHVPFYNMGRTAMDLIAEYIDTEETPESKVLSPEMIIRNTG